MESIRDIKQWVSFSVAFVIMFGMGTLYSYSAYSSDLQQLLDYTGFEVNIVSSVGDLGLYVGGIPVGFFYDKFGPRWTYLGCALSMFVGYGALWAGASKLIPSNALAMGFYLTFVGYGSVSGYMAGLLTNSKNFKFEHRGKISSSLVAAFGLSAAIFSQIYLRALNHSVSTFFAILCFVLGTVPLLGAILVQQLPVEIPQIQTSSSESDDNININLNDDSDDDDQVELENISLDSSSPSPTLDNPAPVQTFSNRPGKYGDIKGIQVLKSTDFWLLFSLVFCCTGIGLTWINIVGTVVKSYKITQISAPVYVISLSLANAVGRLLFGSLTDWNTGFPTVTLMLPCLLLLTITHLILIWVDHYATVLIVSIITGLSYGGSFAIMPVVVNRYFGDRNYGSNLGLVILAVAAGSLSMGAISGIIYDSVAKQHSLTTNQNMLMIAAEQTVTNGSNPLFCYGIRCFRWTYVMTTVVSIIGVFINLVLIRREQIFDRRTVPAGDLVINESTD